VRVCACVRARARVCMLYVIVGNDLIQELGRVHINLWSKDAYSCCSFKPILLRTLC
jgi:hypothetical protein